MSSGFVARAILFGADVSHTWFIAFDLLCADGTRLWPHGEFEIPISTDTGSLKMMTHQVVNSADGTTRVRFGAQDRALTGHEAMELLAQSPYAQAPIFTTGPADFGQ